MFINTVRMMLRMTDVARGKYKVKFFLRMRMSPGKRPNQGIFGQRKRSRPIAKNTVPRIKKNLANEFIK
jgi:hypothetical protein